MATFSYIPETAIPEVLSGALGKVVGVIQQKAEEAIVKVEQKVIEAALKEASKVDITPIENTVNGVDKGIETVQTSIETLDKVMSTIEAPVKALDIALKILKALPAPVPPPVTVALNLLSELIAQLKQIVSSVSTVTGMVNSSLEPIESKIELIRQALNLLKASQALGELASTSEGAKELQEAGILDVTTGTNIFDKLIQVVLKNEETLIGFGDLKGIDLESAYVKKLVKLTLAGQYVKIPVENKGDSLVTIYRQSSSKLVAPVSRELPPLGWTVACPTSGSNWQYSTATLSGLTGNLGAWSTPASCVLGSRKDSSNTVLGNSGISRNTGFSLSLQPPIYQVI